jgi:hypothetical protein
MVKEGEQAPTLITVVQNWIRQLEGRGRAERN